MTRLDVSDHAVLNWLEKVEGVDVVGIRRRIASTVQGAVERQASGVRVQGVTFKLEYGGVVPVVTTALSPHARPHLAQPRRRPVAGN